MARPSIESLLGDYLALFSESVRAHYDQAVDLTEADAELLLTRLGWTCTPPAAIAAPAAVDLSAGESTQHAQGLIHDPTPGAEQPPAGAGTPDQAPADQSTALNTAEGSATVDTAVAPAESDAAKTTAA